MVEQVDVLSQTVGDFGPWQLAISVMMSLLKMPIAWFQLSVMILEAPMDFWCTDAEGVDFRNYSHEKPKIINTGGENPNTAKGRTCARGMKFGQYIQNVSACYVYDIGTDRNVTDRIACTKWEYDNSTFTQNIVSQWNLVCDRKHYSDIAQAVFMFGVLLGNVAFGIAADRFGRKPPLIVAIALQCVCGIISSFTTWFAAFLFFRFLLAIATGGTMIASFVLLMEIVGDSWRTTISILYQLPFPVGVLLMDGVSYFERDWRYFHLILSIISGAFFIYWWFVPESPRWLLAVNRDEEAIVILEDAARKNGRDIKEVRKAVQYRRMVSSQSPDMSETHQASFMDLLRTPNIRRNSICIFISWFVCGLSFFAMSQLMGRIGGNIFASIAMAGAIGIPGDVLAMYAVRGGRKRALMSSFLVAGLSCSIMAFIPKGVYPSDWPRLALSALTIISMTLAFPTMYLFSGEIFPTVIRNIGLGSASMFSRVGSILAPFVKSLDNQAEYLPMIIIGITLMVGVVTSYILPETRGKKLPDSIQDGETLGNKSSDDRENANYLPVPMESGKSS